MIKNSQMSYLGLLIIFPMFRYLIANIDDFHFDISFFLLLIFFHVVVFITSILIVKIFYIAFSYIFLFNLIFFIFIDFQNLINYFNLKPFYLYFLIYLIILFFVPYILRKLNFEIFIILFLYLNLAISNFNILENISIDKMKLVNNSKFKIFDPIKTKADIFIIVPDMMLGDPFLSKEIKHKSDFKKNLEKRGFLVLNNSLSTSSSTFLSTKHLFTSNYFIENNQKNNFEFKKFVYTFWNDTVFENFFLNNEYNMNIVSSNKSFCRYNHNNCISNNNQIFEFYQNYFSQTPLFYIYKKLVQINIVQDFFVYVHIENFFINNFENFVKINKDNLFYIHSYLPKGKPFKKNDCSSYESNFTNNYNKKYSKNLECTEMILDRLINKIIFFYEKINRDVIIIIQSDHGTFSKGQSKRSFSKLSKDEIKESFQNFSAVYSSINCDVGTNRLTQVNTFRFLINCLTNSNIEYLEDKFYWGFHNSKYIKEIDIDEILN